MTQFTLYAAPGTCARVTCIALEECGADYRVELVRFMKGEHRAPGFLEKNPKGKVPTLMIGDAPLSETVAILRYLDQRYPDAALLPRSEDPLEQARVTADLLFCSATLHPIVTRARMPMLIVDGEEAMACVRDKALEAMAPFAALIERRLGDGPWWFGDRWSVMDGYLFWLWFRLQGVAFPMASYPAWQDHAERMTERPSVRAALAQEDRMTAQLVQEGLVVPMR